MAQTTWMPSKEFTERQRRRQKLDASGQVLGRLAIRIAVMLSGKDKPFWTHSLDCGDFVTVTHAAKMRFTGRKLKQKMYFRHSGYAGGAKTVSLELQMSKDPTKVLNLAVYRMLDDNKLRARQMVRLKIYAAEERGKNG